MDVDTCTETVVAELNVPMDRLIETTLKNDQVPPVVMEFTGLTVRGGLSGSSGDSSSFKYGYFNQAFK